MTHPARIADNFRLAACAIAFPLATGNVPLASAKVPVAKAVESVHHHHSDWNAATFARLYLCNLMEQARPSSALGQRQTRQRDAILRVIAEADGPLSVPEIHEQARRQHAPIGLATIYRTLKLLQDGGQVQGVILPSGESRFEPATRGHHEHFQCRGCGHVFDLHECPLHLPRDTVLGGGFIVEDHELTLYGLCPTCAPAAKLN